MSKSLRYTFLVHALVAVIFGGPLLLAPGRWLQLFEWAPIDPLLSRALGAALLALAYASYRGWRAAGWDEVAWLVQTEAIFTTLASIGFLRHLLVASWPFVVWFNFAVYALFAIAWIIALITHGGIRRESA